MPFAGPCKHPPATAKTDGVQFAVTWCSACGSAQLIRNGPWVHPQMGKSGKKCHPSHGDYPLPTREQYAAAGYDVANYDAFMARELAPAPKT